MNLELNDSVFEKFPVLETTRLILREFQFSDKQDIYEIRSNSEVMKYLDRPLQKNISEAEELINKTINSFKEKEGVNWIIQEKITGKVAGYIGYWRLIREATRAEIGYSLKKEFWGQGYMDEALKEVIQFGFEKFNLHSIEANVNPDNNASIKLLEKNRFCKEAHFRENYLFEGKYLDSIIYSLLESD